MIWHNLAAIDLIILTNYIIMALVLAYSVFAVRILVNMMMKSSQKDEIIHRYNFVIYWGSIYLTVVLLVSIFFPFPSIYYFTISYLPLAVNGIVLVEVAFRKIPQFRELHIFKRNFFFLVAVLLYIAYAFSIFVYIGRRIDATLLISSIVSLLFSYLILAYTSLIAKSKIRFSRALVSLIFYMFYFDSFLVLVTSIYSEGEIIILAMHSIIYYIIIVLLLLILTLHWINVRSL